jgi:Xaa-Pro aminopeptidase/Xaa-Pro dipeptidase
LYTDFRYTEAARNEVSGYEVEIYKESLLKSIARRLSRLKVKRLGFEAVSLPYAYYADLRKETRGIALVPTRGCIEGLRAVKDRDELTLIKNAAAVVERVLRKVKLFLKTGVSESEVALQIDCLMRKEGADKESFDTIVAFGESSSMPHAKLSQRRLKRGDTVLIDLGCSVRGYSSDLTRTFFFTSINARQKKVYEAVLGAQQKAISVIRPGIAAAEIDKAARRYISARGYGKEFGHALGHGVGREVHEMPRISSKSEEKVREGMVFTVEPGIYIPGWGGVRIEDMVAVTADGCEVLTAAPKELDEVVVR